MGPCPVPLWNALDRGSVVVDVSPRHGQRLFRDERILAVHNRADWVHGTLRICQERSCSERWAAVSNCMVGNSVLWRVLAGLIRISVAVPHQRITYPVDDRREIVGRPCWIEVFVTPCLRLAAVAAAVAVADFIR
jgi:hypothetical protein